MTTFPTGVANDHFTTLRSSMTSKTQTTGITGNPLQHNLVGPPTVLWQLTGAQILRFSKGSYVEYIYFASSLDNFVIPQWPIVCACLYGGKTTSAEAGALAVVHHRGGG